jgi:hypothetical protein
MVQGRERVAADRPDKLEINILVRPVLEECKARVWSAEEKSTLYASVLFDNKREHFVTCELELLLFPFPVNLSKLKPAFCVTNIVLAEYY